MTAHSTVRNVCNCVRRDVVRYTVAFYLLYFGRSAATAIEKHEINIQDSKKYEKPKKAYSTAY